MMQSYYGYRTITIPKPDIFKTGFGMVISLSYEYDCSIS